MEYLDKTGLNYLWSKIKAKLDTKADKDVYTIRIYRTSKRKNGGSVIKTNNMQLALKQSQPNFYESIPSGYHIVPLHCRFINYETESDYNNNIESGVNGFETCSSPEYYPKAMDFLYTLTVKSDYEFSSYGTCWEVECLLVKNDTQIDQD